MSYARRAGTHGSLRALLTGTQPAAWYFTDMQDPKDPSPVSRLLDSPAAPTRGHGADKGSQQVCNSCNWPAPQTRRFRGRMLCLPCIGEYFEAEGEEDENE